MFAHVCLAIIVICACTRVISGYRFSKIKNGRSSGIAPPTLPHWIPGLRHGFSMGWSAKQFVARCLNKYGGETPFFIDAAGEKILVLLNPKHVRHVFRSVRECDPRPFVHQRVMHQLMGSPHAAIDYYNLPESTVDHDQTVQFRQHLTGAALPVLDEQMYDVLVRNISEITCDREWINIPDLFAFFQERVTRAILEVLLGTEIVDEYPTLAADLWTFIEKTDSFLSLPKFLNAKACATRARLLKSFRELSQKHDVLDAEKALNNKWHPTAGSSLLQAREQMYAKLPGHDHEARAAQILGMVYASTSNLVPASFWLCYETLRMPPLQARVLREVNTSHEATSGKYNFSKLSTTPFLQSLHAETCRKYAIALSTRTVVAPSFALDERYVVAQGTTIVVASKHAGQYTPGWAAVRPSLIEKSLDEFWPERFLVNKEEEKERYSDAGLTGNWTIFGGGTHQCPGRFWARDIGMVLLAIFVGQFEVEIEGVEGVRALDPVWHESAFGTAKPTGKIAARIRKRVV